MTPRSDTHLLPSPCSERSLSARYLGVGATHIGTVRRHGTQTDSVTDHVSHSASKLRRKRCRAEVAQRAPFDEGADRYQCGVRGMSLLLPECGTACD